MSQRFDLEPLPEGAEALLAAERRRPGLTAQDQARLASRIQAAMASMPADPAPSAPGATVASLKLKGAALFLAGVVAGGLGGAALTARLLVPSPVAPLEPPRAIPVEAPAPAPLAASAPPQVEARALPPKPAAPRPVPSAPSRPRDEAVSATDAELARERATLEEARSALVRGNAAEAIEAVQRHAERFPDGRLAEERESIHVQSLLALGFREEAVDRARRFKARYPASIFLPVVEAALSPGRDAGETGN